MVATMRREYAASGVVQLVVPFVDAEARQEYDALGLDYGSRVRVLAYLSNGRSYRNPGAPDFDEMLEHRGYDATGSIKNPLLIERLGDGQSHAVLAWLYRLRARMLAVILRSFKPPTSGLLAASLLGNRYFLDPRNWRSIPRRRHVSLAGHLRPSRCFDCRSAALAHEAIDPRARLALWRGDRLLVGLWLDGRRGAFDYAGSGHDQHRAHRAARLPHIHRAEHAGGDSAGLACLATK